jgi:S1-C subfamily serine protease
MKNKKEQNIMANTFQEVSDAMATVVETISNSVVRVEARRRMPATGIVWSENLIVTAHHVVEFDEDITIGLQDGSTVTATLVGRDPHNDLALLKTDATLTPATWADNESLKVGNLVLALGRAGQKVQSTLGVTSALVNPSDIKRRRDKAEGMHGEHGHENRGKRGGRGGRRGRRGRGGWGRALADGFIQTDVTMYPGFSGGALVSGDGLVHGLNTSGFSRGASIAIPVSTIRSSVGALLADGKIQQGYLGVGVQPARLPDAIADSLEQDTGLLVVSVEKDSPAEKAGIMVGDTLTSLGDDPVEHVDELLIILTSIKVGTEVTVAIVRGGTQQDISVTVGSRD